MKDSELNETTFISTLNASQLFNEGNNHTHHDLQKYLHLNLKCIKQQDLSHLCFNKNCENQPVLCSKYEQC